jgi:hypothetical protein
MSESAVRVAAGCLRSGPKAPRVGSAPGRGMHGPAFVQRPSLRAAGDSPAGGFKSGQTAVLASESTFRVTYEDRLAVFKRHKGMWRRSNAHICRGAIDR